MIFETYTLLLLLWSKGTVDSLIRSSVDDRALIRDDTNHVVDKDEGDAMIVVRIWKQSFSLEFSLI